MKAGDVVTISHGLVVNLGDYQGLRPSITIQRTLVEGTAAEIESLCDEALDLLREVTADEARAMDKVSEKRDKTGGDCGRLARALGKTKFARQPDVDRPRKNPARTEADEPDISDDVASEEGDHSRRWGR